MSCGLVHASYSLPKWQAVKLTFFAPRLCKIYKNNNIIDITATGNGNGESKERENRETYHEIAGPKT